MLISVNVKGIHTIVLLEFISVNAEGILPKWQLEEVGVHWKRDSKNPHIGREGGGIW